eukprot:gene140-203_t
MSMSDAATLADVIRAQSVARPDSVALVFEGRSTSFQQLNRHASQIANGLRALGVQPDERVAYLGKNSDIFIELLLGAVKAHAVMAPVNWRLAGPEIAYIVEDCKAAVLFVGPEFVELIRDIKTQLPSVRHIMTTEGGASEWPDAVAWRNDQSDSDPQVALRKDDIAIQLYTSGTTGRPKGAMLSHDNFLSLLRIAEIDTPDWNKWTEHDVSLVAMPIFHIGGVGIGFFIWDAWNSSHISEIILALFYVGIIGFVLDRAIAGLGHLVTHGTSAQ